VRIPRIITRGPRSPRLLNASTSLRIVLIPAVMGLVLLGGEHTSGAYPAAACLFVLAALTDFFDGYLARRWSMTTTFGSFLDTTADKLLVACALIALVAVDRASPWIAAVIVARELVILGLRGVVAADGLVIKPSPWGKIKTTVQFVAITLAILHPGEPVASLFLDEWVMLVAALVTVVSGIEYLTRFASSLSSSTPSR
jgi:CDP-diacylglycerol---glycerol-3-phosphate 3-phosphatidyltransferase